MGTSPCLAPGTTYWLRPTIKAAWVWESGWWLGPTVSVAHAPQDVRAYLDAIGEFTQALA
jgi:hypothetical protein